MAFAPLEFLEVAGVSKNVAEFHRGQPTFSQGDVADSIKFSAVNGSGKEAVVAMVAPTDFFGEGCMAGQGFRMGTAKAITPTTVLNIGKSKILHVLHVNEDFAQKSPELK